MTPTPIRGRARAWNGARVPLLLLALVLVWGCGRGGDAPPPAPAEPENPMVPLAQSALLYYDDRGGIPDSTRTVIRDPDAWHTQWERATSRRSDPPPPPSVDFDEYMVLLAGAGRMSPGARIQVDSAGARRERTTEADEDVFEVVVRTVHGCEGILADVHPVTIVRVPRFDGRVSFVERSEQGPC